MTLLPGGSQRDQVWLDTRAEIRFQVSGGDEVRTRAKDEGQVRRGALRASGVR